MPNLLKSGQMAAILSKRFDFEWLGPWLQLNPNPLKPDHLKSNLEKVWISNASGLWMVEFQILTVLCCRGEAVLPDDNLNLLTARGSYLSVKMND